MIKVEQEGWPPVIIVWRHTCPAIKCEKATIPPGSNGEGGRVAGDDLPLDSE